MFDAAGADMTTWCSGVDQGPGVCGASEHRLGKGFEDLVRAGGGNMHRRHALVAAAREVRAVCHKHFDDLQVLLREGGHERRGPWR